MSAHSFFLMFRLVVCSILCLALAGQTLHAHDAAVEMADAANVFLKSLGESKQKEVTFAFDDKHRKDWQFIPMDRVGLSFGDLEHQQMLLATALLQTGLSHRGYSTSMQIMSLESVLHEMEPLNPKRDPTKYHLFIFGKPSTEQTWGWRIEGHHVSISFTIAGGKEISSTPLFLGASPGEVRVGNLTGMRVLGRQEDLGRALVKNLSVEQKETAIVGSDAPRDVVNGPGVVAEPMQPAGLLAADMNPQQQTMLRKLIDSFVHQLRPELATADLKKIEEAGFEKIGFAWLGKIQPNKPHYFRVQGPTFVLEYDNTQNNANHVHIVWRDFTNDFGADLLKQHYEKSHAAQSEAVEAVEDQR